MHKLEIFQCRANKKRGRLGRLGDPALSPALIIAPVQNPDLNMNALAFAKKQLSSSSASSMSHRGGVRNIRGSPTLTEIYDNTKLQSDPIDWSSISKMFEPVVVKETQFLQSPTKKRRQSKPSKTDRDRKSKNILNSSVLNSDNQKRKINRILFVPRWEKIKDKNSLVSDHNDEGSDFSAIDEDVSDEAYFSRHAKHLETMRIEFEAKEKALGRAERAKAFGTLKAPVFFKW